MTEHTIPYETLIAVVLGEPVAIDATALEHHLTACAECQATLRLLRAAGETVRLDAVAVPSPTTLARVRSLVSASRPATTSPFAGLKWVFGSLTFDGRQAYATAGLRGSSTSYLLSFTQDAVTVDLEVEPPGPEPGSLWHLTGQLDAPGLMTPVEIALVGGPATEIITTTDEHSVFSVAIESGSYDLLVRLDDRVIVFPEVDVG